MWHETLNGPGVSFSPSPLAFFCHGGEEGELGGLFEVKHVYVFPRSEYSALLPLRR